MSFKVDKQTIKDIELFAERRGQTSIFGFYNRTVTKGAQELLFDIFQAPSSDIKFLEDRRDKIKFFSEKNCILNLNSRSIDFIEHYLDSRRVPLKANIIDATVDALSQRLIPSNDYYLITEGIIHISKLLVDLADYIKEVKTYGIKGSIKNNVEEIEEFLQSKLIRNLIDDPPEKAKDLNFNQINKLDNHFRHKEKEAFRNLLIIVYEIDFLQAMAGMLESKEFSLPVYEHDQKSVFRAVDSFHPFLERPVKNSFEFTTGSSLCFLTGPNMSGKTTFLKTMGLLVYLSHLGLPVPAREFTTSVYEGLFTTINLSDDLSLGYSHFYAEISRLKDIATKIHTSDNLVVIFDELFRGTNVRDAFDASLSVISILVKIRNTRFFISTHLIEVADKLEDSKTIIFKCFKSEMINQNPEYTYLIRDGISSERVGMMILKRENITGLLEQVIEKQVNNNFETPEPGE